MRVIGTAGHVDHGKSKLVEALTGIDPDRLKEEKERQMTIDLGFAWLTLPSGEEVGIVDVPGHEDFVENMLAGVGGIDAALFVVAADEGVMPQTREHLAILDLLGVKSGVIALTKIDLVEDKEWLELIIEEISELLEDTTLAGSPIVPVSSKTGEGLSTLLEELDSCLKKTGQKLDIGRPRLPIDRVFTISGFGTVVTGTLIDGKLRVGQEVEVLPPGKKAHIRGLQTHKKKKETAVPGSRVAINLTGVSKDELSRGYVVTIPGWLEPTTLVDAHLQYLEDAPLPLRHNASVKFFSGSAEVMARVRLLDRETIPPGEEGWVQFRLRKKVALVRGDRFVIRRPSPPLTIGGGLIVDPHPRFHKRFRSEVIEGLRTLAYGEPKDVILQFLKIKGLSKAKDLVRRSNIAEDEAAFALEELVTSGEVVVLDSEFQKRKASGRELASSELYLLSIDDWRRLKGKLVSLLRGYHKEHPLRKGMPRSELKSRLQGRIKELSTKLFNEMVVRAVREGELIEEEATLRLPEHSVKLAPHQQILANELFATLRANPFSTPSVAECEAKVGEEVLSALIEGGEIVKVSADVLFLKSTYDEMVRRVIERLKKEGSITIAQVRDMFRTSRKYALALMEHLDEKKVTKRVGDERILR